MGKIRTLINSKVNSIQAAVEINALADEVVAGRAPLLVGTDVRIITIQEALDDLHSDAIRNTDNLRLEGQPYADLTRWNFLEDDEFLCVYNIDANKARLLSDRELDQYILSTNGLTPTDIRRWYANRKSEFEFLVSDYDAVNFWVVED